VRAEQPSDWVGETFDRWDGVSWLTDRGVPTVIGDGSPFAVPATGGGAADSGTSDLQTFYVVQSTPNLVFHADDARQVWFPTRQLIVRGEDTLVSPIGLGSGAIYTVRSVVATPTPAQLRAVGVLPPASGLSTRAATVELVLPRPYPEVAALVQQVTAGAVSPYDKVQALIAWMGSHTRYSIDIPPLPAGADAVDQFLFTTHVGFCTQISTALAVMLRTAGVPAREAVGYVPGPYNPITDLYDVQARDAHAWVQVWFPGYGWQSFDPTAAVPVANPSPGGTLLGAVGHELARHLALMAGIATMALLGAALAALRRHQRRRPAGPAEALSRRIERVGARAGRRRRPGETLGEYASALDAMGAGPPGPFAALAAEIERAAYDAGAAAAAAVAGLDRKRVPAPGPRRPRRRRGRRTGAGVGPS
jgi:transglutaminase-like putative cysteine protease